MELAGLVTSVFFMKLCLSRTWNMDREILPSFMLSHIILTKGSQGESIFLFYEEHVIERGCVKLPWANHIFLWSFPTISNVYHLWFYWIFCGILGDVNIQWMFIHLWFPVMFAFFFPGKRWRLWKWRCLSKCRTSFSRYPQYPCYERIFTKT